MLLWLFLTTFSFACENEVCDRLCQADGEKRGIVVEGECGCWNPAYKVRIKLPKSIGWSSKDKRNYYEPER
jgi:hypothetical protein